MEGLNATVKVAFEGMQKNTEVTASILTQMKSLVRTVGIGVAIWQGFDFIIKPILSMIKLLIMVLFLPMMPLLKTMLTRMTDIMNKVREAQDAAGGEGMGAFLAGFSELLSEPTVWAGIGILIAGGFAAQLVAGGGLGGALLAGISLKMIWDVATDKEGLTKSLQKSLGAGLAAGIAVLLFGGGGIAAIAIGALVATLGIAFAFSVFSINEDDIFKSIMGAFGAGLAAGVLAKGVLALLGVGGGAAAIVAISIGTIVFAALVSFKFGKLADKATEGEMAKEGILGMLFGGIPTDTKANALLKLLDNVGVKIGSSTDETSVTGSLGKASTAWGNMSTASQIAVSNIILALSQIPKEIKTIHRIVTVYETSGKKP